MALVTVNTSPVPSSFCFTSWQQSWPELVSLVYASLAGNANVFVTGNTVPGPADRDKYWFRELADGSPDRVYRYWHGYWVSRHQVPANSSERRMWVGTDVALETYDGGTAGVVTDTTGPFWTIDASFAARFPVGVGTFAASGTVTVTATTTGTGVVGEDQHVQTLNELATHAHLLNVTHSSGYVWGPPTATGENPTPFSGHSPANEDQNSYSCQTAGSSAAMNNLPPFYTVYFIRRTARLFYVV